MRRRFQKPRIRNKEGYWVAQFRDLEGRKRKVSLGPVAKTRKADAEDKLDRLLEPLTASVAEPTPEHRFGAFVRQVYVRFYQRKWKASTTACNVYRVNRYLVGEFEHRSLGSLSRDELQSFLDRKAADGLSHSIVAHLRWDLRQILRMAVVEGYLPRNPAELLFVPREAKRFPKPRLTLEQVRLLFPSERGTPIRNGNCWSRYFRPRLETVGLEWANFQVMRRTHSTLMDELGVDPQVRADQMGHTVDVNQNQYTRASLERRKTAVNQLEKALGVA